MDQLCNNLGNLQTAAPRVLGEAAVAVAPDRFFVVPDGVAVVRAGRSGAESHRAGPRASLNDTPEPPGPTCTSSTIAPLPPPAIYRDVLAGGGRHCSPRIDPRSGYPAPDEVASVSVPADDCTRGDPLHTTPSVLGAECGMAYVRMHGLGVSVIAHTGHSFERRLSSVLAAESRR